MSGKGREVFYTDRNEPYINLGSADYYNLMYDGNYLWLMYRRECLIGLMDTDTGMPEFETGNISKSILAEAKELILNGVAFYLNNHIEID